MKIQEKLPAPTAQSINEAHRLARSSAETAVQHAIKCGQLLAAKKTELGRGNFDTWVERNCDFGRRMAYHYIKAGESCNALHGYASLRQALGYEKPKAKPVTPEPQVMNPPESAARGSEAGNQQKAHVMGIGAAHRAAETRPVEAAPPSTQLDDAPEMPSEEELAAIDREIQEAEARVLSADDVTTGYHVELKRLAAELAAVKLSRDGYMDGKAEITRLLKAEQRKTERLTKRVSDLEKENEALRERVAVMEEAA